MQTLNDSFNYKEVDISHFSPQHFEFMIFFFTLLVCSISKCLPPLKLSEFDLKSSSIDLSSQNSVGTLVCFSINSPRSNKPPPRASRYRFAFFQLTSQSGGGSFNYEEKVSKHRTLIISVPHLPLSLSINVLSHKYMAWWNLHQCQ